MKLDTRVNIYVRTRCLLLVLTKQTKKLKKIKVKKNIEKISA